MKTGREIAWGQNVSTFTEAMHKNGVGLRMATPSKFIVVDAGNLATSVNEAVLGALKLALDNAISNNCEYTERGIRELIEQYKREDAAWSKEPRGLPSSEPVTEAPAGLRIKPPVVT